MTTPACVGIVGLGLVGGALGSRLLAAGFSVIGYDLRPQARAAFGGRAVETVRAVGAACECVVLGVFDTADVVGVLEHVGGLLADGHRVRTVVDCSTGDPDQLTALAQRLAKRGVDFIEGPLSGSSQQIAAGQATQLLGGEASAIAACDEVLQALCPQRIHVGSAGSAAKAKLATNLVLGLNRAALAEGMVFAESLGIEPRKFLELVLATPARSGAAEAKGEMMVRGDFAPQSRIRQHLKDVELMLASAARAGQALPLSQTHAALMRASIEAGDGELDNAGLIRQIRRQRHQPD